MNNESSLTSCIDWFQCVFDNIPYDYVKIGFPSDYKVLNKLLNILCSQSDCKELLQFVDNGYFGFKFRISVAEGITILLCGPKTSNNRITTCLQITGKGCSIISQSNKWFELLSFCESNNVSYKRLDLAIDIRGDSKLSMWYLFNKIKGEHYKSIFKKGFSINGVPPENEVHCKCCPLTIYSGSRKSSCFTRFYNKAVEQNLDPLINTWTRCEMEIKDYSRISCIIRTFINFNKLNDMKVLNSIIIATLNDFIQILDDNDFDVCSIWKEFISEIINIKIFANPKSSGSFFTSLDWFNRACSKLISQYFLVFSKEEFFLHCIDLAYKEYANFTPLLISNVNEAKKSLGLKDKVYLNDVINKGLNYVKSIKLTEGDKNE